MKFLTITSEDSVPYIYFIATYGTTCGQTGTFMHRHLLSKGFSLSAAYSMKMADDWTVWFDLSDSRKLEKLLHAEAPQLEKLPRRSKPGSRVAT